MKLIIVLSLVFLCTNHALSEEFHEVGDEIVAENATESKIQSCYAVNNKTGLADMNIDCLHMICEGLSITDLMSLVESEQAHASAIEEVMKHRFTQKHLFLTIKHGDDKTLKVDEKQNRIDVEDSVKFEFVTFLQKFGHLILSFEMHVHPDISKANFSAILEQINEYCSDSFIKLDIARYYHDVIDGDNMLENIQKPFKIAEYLLIRCTAFDHLHNSNLTFPEMFPALRYLQLDHFRTHNGVWINQTCPNLEYLLAGAISKESVDSFQELIQSNPQIIHLGLDMKHVTDSLKLLYAIAQSLPNLGSLDIAGYGNDTDNNEGIEIHFEHLKTLTLSGRGTSLPQNTTFDQLEVLETAEDYTGDSDRWMNLFKNQKTLKRLIIKQMIKDSDILEIANTDSNLMHLIFKCKCRSERHKYSRFNIGFDTVPNCSCDAKIESIILLIRNCKNLQDLVLYSGWATTDSVFEELQKHLPNDWTISRGVNDSQDYVYFKRKTDD